MAEILMHIAGYLLTLAAGVGVGWFWCGSRQSKDQARALRILLLEKEEGVQAADASKADIDNEIEQAFQKPGWQSDLANDLGIDPNDSRFNSDDDDDDPDV